MKWYEIIFIFIVLLGAVCTAYQLFQMTKLDASCRGLKHPGLWGLFAIGGSNQGGLMLYLIGRRNYPSSMTLVQQQIMDSRKNKITVGLIFIVIGSIALVISILTT